MGSSRKPRKELSLGFGTIVCFLLTFHPGADALPDTNNEPQVNTINALVGEDVTIPCRLNGDPATDLDLITVSVTWTLTLINGTETSVYRYSDLQHHPNRPGSKIEDSDLRKGDASLFIERLQLSDEGKYKCIVIATPDKKVATSMVQVSAKPTCAVSDPKVEMTPKTERSVTCYVSYFYPVTVKVLWVKYSKVSYNRTALDRDTCNTVPVPNIDGTFNVTNVLSVKLRNMNEDGDIYSCIVNHRSLRTELALNFTLTVQKEQQSSYAAVLGACLAIVILMITGVCIIFAYMHYKKEPPEVSEITEPELTHMKRTALTCDVSNFRPNALDICLYLKRGNDKVEIYVWNSKDSKISSNKAGDEELPLLESGSTNNKPLMVAMKPVVTSKKLFIVMSSFSCQCVIEITPRLTDNDALFILEVNHPALKKPISKELRLKVNGAPPVLSAIMAPQYQRHDDSVTLTCRMTKFYPEKLHVTWVKEDLMKHKPPFVIHDSEETFSKQHTVESERGEKYQGYYSVCSNLKFTVDVKNDHGVKYICRAKHGATNYTAQSDMDMYVTGIKKKGNCQWSQFWKIFPTVKSTRIFMR
ncbi:uncharacterized protein LOC142103983 isoform X2 [Mixophyes fleayi]|uniref:uncharacterized protein LOC142103983 isoform X2 n=1 Tax=Mixophyes fleayi TaxID=3061075 RepID=UPI003F4E3B0F